MVNGSQEPEAAAAATSGSVETQPLTGEQPGLEARLEEEKSKAERYLANWQRAQADFINFKKRNELERTETTRFTNAMLLLKLLPVIDDLERALGTIPANLAGLTWFDGMRLIHRKLLAVLESEGVQPIEAVGQDFDPHWHEAVLHEPGPDGKVTEELQRGYKLHDRVIRPSMVKVGRKAQ